MFAKLSILALVLPLVSSLSLTLSTTNVDSDGSVNVTWTTNSTDPSVFNIYLVNFDEFHSQLALANNVPASDNSRTLNVGSVPATSGYTLQATTISDINDVLSETPQFSISPAVSSSVSSTSSSAASSSGSVTGTGTTSVSVSVSESTATTTTTSSGFGTTNTVPASSGSGSVSGSSTGSASSSGASTTPSNAAVSGNVLGFGSAAGMLLAGLIAAL